MIYTQKKVRNKNMEEKKVAITKEEFQKKAIELIGEETGDRKGGFLLGTTFMIFSEKLINKIFGESEGK